jgi:hypothetical protein
MIGDAPLSESGGWKSEKENEKRWDDRLANPLLNTHRTASLGQKAAFDKLRPP